MRRILITGVTGFVGHYTASAFLTRFASVAETFGVGRSARPNSLPTGVRYITASLADPRAVRSMLRDINPTDILHLAAQASVSETSANPLLAWESNVGNLIHLAEGIIDIVPSANVYFASSGEVYGRAFLNGQPLCERAVAAPISTYAKTKLVGEELLLDALGGDRGGCLAILRPFNHVGPGQDERFVVASFAAQIARIEVGLAPPVLEVGDLSARRDFLDVRDVVDAYADIVAAAERLKQVCLYNICSGQARTIESLLLELKALSRASFEVKVAPDRLRPSEIPVAFGNASAITAEIGWKPRRSLHDTLAWILDRARANLSAVETSRR